jgi:hypothetical protein
MLTSCNGRLTTPNQTFRFLYDSQRLSIGVRRTRALSKRSGFSRVPQSPTTSSDNSWILLFTCLSSRRPFAVAS